MAVLTRSAQAVTGWSAAWTRQPAAVTVAALAAYRLAHLWTVEQAAPARALHAHVRLRLHTAHNDRLRRLADTRAMTVAERLSQHPALPLTDCVVCAGFWSAAAVAVAASAPGARRWCWPALTVLAMSCAPILHRRT
ncbi:MAG: hypothetical protein ACRCZP_20120 [Phycicoccus sp.]